MVTAIGTGNHFSAWSTLSVAVFRGDCQGLACVVGEENYYQSEIYWASVDQEIYYILVYGENGDDDFSLVINEFPLVTNDSLV